MTGGGRRRPASSRSTGSRSASRSTPAAVDRFLARHEVPIVEGDRCTFLYRGEADEVRLVHRIVGLPDRLPLRRMRGTDLWYVVLELPEGSRVEYQLEVRRGEHASASTTRSTRGSRYSPVGTSSVCFAHGYDDARLDRSPTRRPGPATLIDLVVPQPGAAPRLPGHRSTCRPGSAAPSRYPLLVVHDGGDFLQYAAAKTVLDNLIHRLDVAETRRRRSSTRATGWSSTPNSAAHARFLTGELLPRLEAELPLVGSASGRCLMGSSFGAVAALSAAYRAPDTYGSLLLMSGSFVFTDIGEPTTAAGRCSTRW